MMTHPLHVVLERLADPRPLSAGPLGTRVRRCLAPLADLVLVAALGLARLALSAQARKNA